MVEVRPFRPTDIEALYAIALATGDAGADAFAMYRDKRLVGEVYAAPYATLSPQTAFVVEDANGVAGYIVGALDTRAFEARLEADWWPALRRVHADPGGDYFAAPPDDRLRWLIHRPPRASTALVTAFPSHLHINLLPRLQGQGLGRRLIDLWLQTVRGLGSPGAHLGVNQANHRAIRFYRAYGLSEPSFDRPPPPGVIWFASELR